jgi:hypothetical protein
MFYMNSILLRLAAAVVLLAATQVCGQSANANASANNKPGTNDGQTPQSRTKTADEDWADLTALTIPPSSSHSRVQKTADQHASAHVQSVAQSRDLAKAANNFYVQHPDDSRAKQARKTEALALVHGVGNGNLDEDRKALSTAQAFRHDTSISAKDRFEVALALDHRELTQKVAAHGVSNSASEEKKLIENWRTEFGDLPQIEVYAVGVARRADPAVGAAMAAQTVRSAAAPADIKLEAKSLSNRAGLLGSAIPLKVITADGVTIDLAHLGGKTTVIVVWRPQEPDALQELARFARAIRPTVQVIYIALGGSATDVAKAAVSLPMAGISSYATGDTAMKVLHIYSAPYMFIINGSGVLSDFGPVSQSMAILTRSGAIYTKHS